MSINTVWLFWDRWGIKLLSFCLLLWNSLLRSKLSKFSVHSKRLYSLTELARGREHNRQQCINNPVNKLLANFNEKSYVQGKLEIKYANWSTNALILYIKPTPKDTIRVHYIQP